MIPAWRRVLARLACGATLHHGTAWYCTGGGGAERLHPLTVGVLLDAGHVERGEDGLYRITAAGRAALEEEA